MDSNKEQAAAEQSHIDFVQLFARHQRDIQAYIRALVPSTADADDVMQETSVILWEKFSGYDTTKDFGRWGCGIARNVVLRLRRRTASDKHWFSEELLQLISSDRMNQRTSLWESQREALRECIASLDSKQRRYIELRYACNM